MEHSGGTPGQSAEQSVQQVPPLVRVSEVAWFHIRFDAKKGSAAPQGAFIVQTLSDLRVLMGKANGEEPILHLFSQQLDKTFALRRVVLYRGIPGTDMHMFELEDGQAVLWCWNEDEDGLCAEINGPAVIGKLANISLLSTSADSTARENAGRSSGALGTTQEVQVPHDRR